MPSLKSVRLPLEPAQRLEAFGQAALGDRWRSALAPLLNTSKRMLNYWQNGHCPADLDARLIVAANALLAQHRDTSSVIVEMRQQLEAEAAV